MLIPSRRPSSRPSTCVTMAKSTRTSRATSYPAALVSARKQPTPTVSQCHPHAERKHVGRLSYKRACERPPVVVAKRNARERRRVNNVNAAFETLRMCVPQLAARTKRVRDARRSSYFSLASLHRVVCRCRSCAFCKARWTTLIISGALFMSLIHCPTTSTAIPRVSPARLACNARSLAFHALHTWRMRSAPSQCIVALLGSTASQNVVVLQVGKDNQEDT